MRLQTNTHQVTPCNSLREAVIAILTTYKATMNGVNLYPPPAPWVPPNCVFEVDDVTKDWTWGNLSILFTSAS